MEYNTLEFAIKIQQREVKAFINKILEELAKWGIKPPWNFDKSLTEEQLL